MDVRLSTRCVEVKDSHTVLCEDKEGNLYEITTDTIISAGGMKANEDIVDVLRDSVIDFAWIGD